MPVSVSRRRSPADSPRRSRRAAYFVVAEALANAGKHAERDRVEIAMRAGRRAARARGHRRRPRRRRPGGRRPERAAPTGRGARRHASTSPARRRPHARSARSCRARRDRRGPRAAARRPHPAAARQRDRGGRGRRATATRSSARSWRTAGPGDRRHPPAAGIPRRGPAGRARAARGARRGRRSWSSRSTSRRPTPPSCSRAGRGGSATCSRTASCTSPTSSRRCAGSPTAARRSTPRSSRSCSRAAARGRPLDELTPREREVLGLMAEGRSNAGIAEALVLTVGAVEKHVQSIMSKLDLPPAANDHRRVLRCSRTCARTLRAPRAESAPPSGTSSGPRPAGPELGGDDLIQRSFAAAFTAHARGVGEEHATGVARGARALQGNGHLHLLTGGDVLAAGLGDDQRRGRAARHFAGHEFDDVGGGGARGRDRRIEAERLPPGRRFPRRPGRAGTLVECWVGCLRASASSGISRWLADGT